MQGRGGAGWQHGVVIFHEHFILLPQGPSTVLGYSQGGRERSCVPGLSTRGISCGGKSFVLFWGIVSLLDELFPLWRVIPWGSHVGKRKKSKVQHPAFYLCRVGQVWMRFVLVCLGFWHCEHSLCVCFW